jgi:hypothetical protein
VSESSFNVSVSSSVLAPSVLLAASAVLHRSPCRGRREWASTPFLSPVLDYRITDRPMSAISESLSPSGSFQIRSQGTKGRPVLFLAGPPVSSLLFRRIQERMAPQRTLAVDFVPGKCGADLKAMAASLGRLCETEDVQMLVAHGLAVPLAVAASTPGIHTLVISNGPTGKLDPVSGLLAKMPLGVLERLVLNQQFFRTWLSSSLGLRRTVVNPYVMDKETVLALTQKTLQDAPARSQAAFWLRGLPDLLPINLPEDLNVVALWGDGDRLYPLDRIVQNQSIAIHSIPGARFFYPQERPWEMADACLELIKKSTV